MNPYGPSWRKLRARHLSKHPLCVYCGQMGRVTPATVVDHVIPHRGDEALFWDQNNWQSLCKLCHDSAKRSLEKTGHLRGSDTNGYPLDIVAHPWFREDRASDE